VDVAITGTWRADPADGYWLADPLVLAGTEKGGRFTTRGPLVVVEGGPRHGPLAEPLDAQWRAIPDINGFRPQCSTPSARTWAACSAGSTRRSRRTRRRSRRSCRPSSRRSTGRSSWRRRGSCCCSCSSALAAYAVILVAALLLERRRTETALLRSRGAGTGHLALMSLGEALIVTVPAVIVAPWLAMLLVQAVRLNPAMEGVGLSRRCPDPRRSRRRSSAASSRSWR
jgi:hypothetical protein